MTELLGGHGGTVTALLVMRLTGLVAVAPVFSARPVPMTVRTAVLLVLAVCLWPAAMAAAPAGVELTVSTALHEAMVGLVVGLGAAVFVGAAEMAGDMLAIQMGLSGANLVDPMSQTQMPVLGQFMGMVVLAFLVSFGGHVLVVETLARSLAVVPPGGALNPAAGVATVFHVGSVLFLLGLRFAAPVIGAMMISNAALGVMARTVPQLNVLMVAFPVQIAVGLFAMAVSLPFMATYFAEWPMAYQGVADTLLRGLLPGEGR